MVYCIRITDTYVPKVVKIKLKRSKPSRLFSQNKHWIDANVSSTAAEIRDDGPLVASESGSLSSTISLGTASRRVSGNVKASSTAADRHPNPTSTENHAPRAMAMYASGPDISSPPIVVAAR